MENVLMVLIIWVTLPISLSRLKYMRQNPEKYLEGKPLSYYKKRYPSPWHSHVWFRYYDAMETFVILLLLDVTFAGTLLYRLVMYILGFFGR